MKKSLSLAASLIAACFSFNAVAENKPVGITADLMSVTITHNGQPVEIVRNQDNGNKVIDAFAKMDGSAEATNKAMTLMGKFCRENRKAPA